MLTGSKIYNLLFLIPGLLQLYWVSCPCLCLQFSAAVVLVAEAAAAAVDSFDDLSPAPVLDTDFVDLERLVGTVEQQRQ